MLQENQEIIAEFVVESQEHLSNIENELLAIEEGGENIDIELVNKVFRSVHSIKGASGFLGFTTIGELGHGMENVLNLLRNRELVPDGPMIDILLKAADALRGLISDISRSNSADVSTHLEALHGILHRQSEPTAKSAVDMVEFAGPDGIILRTTRLAVETQKKLGHRLWMIDFDLIKDADEKKRTPLALIREILTYGEIIEACTPFEAMGGLEDNAPLRVRYLVLAGSLLEENDMIASALGIDAARVSLASPMEQSAAAGSADVSTPPPPPPEPLAGPVFEPVFEPVAAAPEPAPAPVVETPSAPSAEPPREEQRAAADATTSKSSVDAIADTSIRVSVNLLDHLMNLAGELVLGRNQLLQMIAAKSENGLDSVGARLNQVTSELQEAIMQTRMQQIGSVFSKFPRVVRDLSNKLGKQCELTVEGKEVELDKSLLETITDPLTHLVRNSIDHGIEKPDVRASANKPVMGHITLKAFHQAGKVNITITDDGRGIDPVVIKKKAIEKGLIQPGRDREMSDRDALRLIFHPGFSTAEKLTDVSGRGVGMDVVKTNIERAGGTVEVDSRPGAGTSVQIRLPLTLAIIPSLVVRCCDERYAIPQVSISELVRIKASDVAGRIEHVGEAEVLRLRGNLLPLVRLSRALGVQSKYRASVSQELVANQRENIADRRGDTAGPPAEDIRTGTDRREDTAAGALNIIVVETGQLRYGLIVDGLQDSEEIVVKPLGSHLKGTPCLAGATILGDGKVALILDVPGIATHCQLRIPDEDDEQAAVKKVDKQAKEMQKVLLFTNDPAEQFAIPMGLVSRIERIRSSQIDTVGGQEVLQYRGASLPLLILERYIKARPRPEKPSVYVVVFRIGRQEIGLVAPTLVDIRDIVADLDEVTFREPGIIGSTVVEGRATRVVDLVELGRLAKPEWMADVAATQAKHKGNRVLLAEDSNFFRKQVADVLTNEGYDVLPCEDGIAAWQALQTADPPVDLVVTDVEMPNLDGYGLTRQIKGDHRFVHIPVIAVTSLAGEEDIVRGRQAGVDDYQVKLDRDQLIDAVGRFLKGTGELGRLAGEREEIVSTTLLDESTVALAAEIEFATFYVGNLLLGIDIRKTEEINRQLDLTTVPNAPAFVRGVVNLRGEVVTVVDMRTILGLEPAPFTQSTRNVVVRAGTERVGLLVDSVADVVTVKGSDIEDPPANVNGVDGQFFQGVFKLESSLLVVLNVGAALSVDGKKH